MSNDKQNDFELVKFISEGVELDVNVSPKEETIWLSQEELSLLYSTTISTINYHIKNVYKELELSEKSTFREIRKVQKEGNRSINRVIMYYNLDMIISIGYRVNSKRGVIFRQWANKVLKEYLIKGYVINENRVIVSNDNYIELKNEVVDIKKRLNSLEDRIDVNDLSIYSILFNGQFYDAYTLFEQKYVI